MKIKLGLKAIFASITIVALIVMLFCGPVYIIINGILSAMTYQTIEQGIINELFTLGTFILSFIIIIAYTATRRKENHGRYPKDVRKVMLSEIVCGLIGIILLAFINTTNQSFKKL